MNCQKRDSGFLTFLHKTTYQKPRQKHMHTTNKFLLPSQDLRSQAYRVSSTTAEAAEWHLCGLLRPLQSEHAPAPAASQCDLHTNGTRRP